MPNPDGESAIVSLHQLLAFPSFNYLEFQYVFLCQCLVGGFTPSDPDFLSTHRNTIHTNVASSTILDSLPLITIRSCNPHLHLTFRSTQNNQDGTDIAFAYLRILRISARRTNVSDSPTLSRNIRILQVLETLKTILHPHLALHPPPPRSTKSTNSSSSGNNICD
jgi:hypothetical protein